MKLFPIKKLLILVTILALPGFLYYMLKEKGKNRYKTLPYFGAKTLPGTFHSRFGKKIADTTYHIVQNFDFLNQNNEKISLDSLKDKILIINLFYTNGSYPVDLTNSIITKISKGYSKNERVRFLSINIDPAANTQEFLNQYANKLKAMPGKWDLLTNKSDSLYNFIKQQLLLDVEKKEDHISYSNMFLLLDYKHQIRGFYDATNKDAVAKLDDEIKVLITEELRNIDDGR